MSTLKRFSFIIATFTIAFDEKVTPRFPLSFRTVLPVAWEPVHAVTPTFIKFESFENKLFAKKVKGIKGDKHLKQVKIDRSIITIVKKTLIAPHRCPRHVTVLSSTPVETDVTRGAFLGNCSMVKHPQVVKIRVIIVVNNMKNGIQPPTKNYLHTHRANHPHSGITSKTDKIPSQAPLTPAEAIGPEFAVFRL